MQPEVDRRTAPNRTVVELKLQIALLILNRYNSQSYRGGIEMEDIDLAKELIDFSQSYRGGIEIRYHFNQIRGTNTPNRTVVELK